MNECLLEKGISNLFHDTAGYSLFIIFKYIPMFGISVAFLEYSPFKGIAGSEWVGLHYFRRLFAEGDFPLPLKNTPLLNLLDVLFFFRLLFWSRRC